MSRGQAKDGNATTRGVSSRYVCSRCGHLNWTCYLAFFSAEILPTVLDCLKQLNLSSLGEVLLEAGFDVVASNDAKISLFAPSNYTGDKEEEDVLGTHIVNKTILAAFLENGDKLETLSEGLFLHISQIKQDNEEVKVLSCDTLNSCYV